ncbi:MAG: DsbE family thiol:disulfide interchange protein [Alphaproteobacteria bacterium]|nr:DsbE family thiol:disulfide interchange protein [Alphaproteobacteria bacterium]HPF47052.1 DsbE family thiol:disulfide interchange protein [Emcibacteraceae bacterium]HRW30307.1 DsbE family thiol:disulfide interchange protein [Emcibacteraceae bacterium]
MNKFIPLAIFCAIAIALYVGLSLNPSNIPSVLINDPVPEFALPAVGGEEGGFSSADLAAEDGVVLVNFFASWCMPCYVEHPFLMELKKRGYKIYGVAYKDKSWDTNGFIKERGNPYYKLAADNKGRVAIDFGVYGVPETYVIKNGIIRYKHAGPIQEMDFEDKVIPIIESVDK